MSARSPTSAPRSRLAPVSGWAVGAAALLALSAWLIFPPGAEGPRVARRLADEGRERELASLAEKLLADPALDSGAIDGLLDAALHDAEHWNGERPSWKRRLLERWAAAHGFEKGAAWLRSAEVSFELRGGGPLYLEGDWNADGDLSDTGGWRATPMRCSGGVCRARERLRFTRFRNVYHAVARTAPWPKGRAVARADFSVAGPKRVALLAVVPPLKAAALPSRDVRAEVSLLGIDGATWHLILPLARRGLLPSFDRLLREGAWATETAAFVKGDGFPSLPNIYAAATGVPPSRHGVGHGYFGANVARKASPVWRIVSDAGLSAAAVSMWATFPPDRIRGAVVTEAFFALRARADPNVVEIAQTPQVAAFASLFGVSSDGIRKLLKYLDRIDGTVETTWPSSLEEELARELPPVRVDPKEGLESVTTMLDAQAAVAADKLLDRGPVSLLCLYQSQVDHLSHRAWLELEPSLGSGSGRGLLDAYRRVDAVLGALMARSRHVVVFSDHGFGAMPRSMLDMRMDLDRLLSSFRQRAKLERGYAIQFHQRAHEWTLWLPQPVETGARERLASFLRDARYAPGGQPVFRGVSSEEDRERVAVRFRFDHPEPAWITGIDLPGGRAPLDELFDVVELQAYHVANGLLAVWGPAARPGPLAEPVYITDVAPTVLALLGLPPGGEMEGRVIEDALKPEWRAAHPPLEPRAYGAGGSGWLRLLQAVRWGTAARRLLGS